MAHLVNVPRLVRSNLSMMGLPNRRLTAIYLRQDFFSETSFVVTGIVKSVDLLTSASLGGTVNHAEPVIVVKKDEVCSKPSSKGDHPDTSDLEKISKQSVDPKSSIEIENPPSRLSRAIRYLSSLRPQEDEETRELKEKAKRDASYERYRAKCQKLCQKRDEKERKSKEKEQRQKLRRAEKEAKKQRKMEQKQARKQWILLEKRKQKEYKQETVEPIIGDDEEYVNEKVNLRPKMKYPKHLFSVMKKSEQLYDANGDFPISMEDRAEAGCSIQIEVVINDDKCSESGQKEKYLEKSSSSCSIDDTNVFGNIPISLEDYAEALEAERIFYGGKYCECDQPENKTPFSSGGNQYENGNFPISMKDYAEALEAERIIYGEECFARSQPENEARVHYLESQSVFNYIMHRNLHGFLSSPKKSKTMNAKR